jgi:hypothetical protein
MTSAQHDRWNRAGRPFRLARPLVRLRDVLRAAGYTVYDIGNNQHLDAQPPEDHTPYSETGWPVKSPYGVGCAIDVMPPPAGRGLPSLQVLGRRLVNDRITGRAGFIKYINWGPENDRTAVQDRFMPDHVRRISSDTGHIHVSQRSDMVDTTAFDGYNPLGDDDMSKIILALGADGTVYRCDFLQSIPAPGLTAANLGDMRYVAGQMGVELVHGPGDNAEWTWGGWLRKGWSPQVFGPVPVAAAAPAPIVVELNQEQVDAAVLQSLAAARFETRAVLPE